MNKENKENLEEVKTLKEKLFYKKRNVFDKLSDDDIENANNFCDGYKTFLDEGKTERAACLKAIELAKENGFREFIRGETLKTGDKVYSVNRGKAITLAVIGSDLIENGVNIAAAHIDSPRIDLKQNPIFEDDSLCYFKTHYYGGVKKYQWTAIPLALHGVVVKDDGTRVEIKIGEDEGDPVFCITDLLPHLASKQYKRPATELIRGEELNILIGSRPFKAEGESELVKLNIMKLLYDKYKITEYDFVSAELEMVPAFKAKDVGIDRSMIGGYGQDDRVCAFTSLKALLGLDGNTLKKTAVCVLADKEEIGSCGNTGMDSRFLEYFISDLVCSLSNKRGKAARIRQCLSNSKCLSADVCAALDPTFPDVSEKRNTPMMNGGAVVAKYLGSRGKSGSNDACAEYVGEIRRIFDENNVLWQTGELGKVDEGGGGTVAMFIAKLNVDTIDVGVPVLSMHSPMELTSKADVYMAYKAFKAFYSSST